MQDLKNIFSQTTNFFIKIKNKSLIWVVIFIPYVFIIYLFIWHNNEITKIPESRIIIIDKGNYSLDVYSYNGNKLGSYNIALGKNFGNKKIKGDLKTPEGIFKIVSIEDSHEWGYDFEDDTLPEIIGAYGPYFLRIEVPGFEGIGIHGTHDDNSLGKRSSHGCIRMNNNDLSSLKNEISIGTIVIIIPSIDDLIVNDSIDSLSSDNIKEN